MGQAERRAEDARQSRRERAREGRQRRATNAAKASIRGGDWVAIAALITAFAEEGGAVRLGYTRDGGALAVGCYLGDDYATEYVRPNEDIRAALTEIAEAWLAEAGIAYHQLVNEYGRQESPQTEPRLNGKRG